MQTLGLSVHAHTHTPLCSFCKIVFSHSLLFKGDWKALAYENWLPVEQLWLSVSKESSLAIKEIKVELRLCITLWLCMGAKISEEP